MRIFICVLVRINRKILIYVQIFLSYFIHLNEDKQNTLYNLFDNCKIEKIKIIQTCGNYKKSLAHTFLSFKFTLTKSTFLRRFVSTNSHVLYSWAFSCLIHSKILRNGLEILNAPFHV